MRIVTREADGRVTTIVLDNALVVGSVIVAIFWIAFGWTSAWKEHQCETAHYQRDGSNPPILTPCVCGPKRAEQAQDADREAPECDWPEVDVQWATFWAITFTLCAIIWQARETKRSADAAAKSVELTRKSMRLARHNTAIALAAKRNADRQLRLAFTPHVKIRPKTFGPLNDERFNLAMELASIGTAPARIERIDYEIWTSYGKNAEGSAATDGITVAINDPEILIMTYTFQGDVLADLKTFGQILMTADMAIHFTHPVTGSLWRTYRRVVLCNFPSGLPILIPETSADWDGRFSKGPPEIPEKYRKT